MIHKACMPVYMNSGKIVADGRDGTGGKFEGSTRGPRGPKKQMLLSRRLRSYFKLCYCMSLFMWKFSPPKNIFKVEFAVKGGLQTTRREF